MKRLDTHLFKEPDQVREIAAAWMKPEEPRRGHPRSLGDMSSLLRAVGFRMPPSRPTRITS